DVTGSIAGGTGTSSRIAGFRMYRDKRQMKGAPAREAKPERVARKLEEAKAKPAIDEAARARKEAVLEKGRQRIGAMRAKRVEDRRSKYDAISKHLSEGGSVMLTTHLRRTQIKNPAHLRITKGGDVQLVSGKNWLNLLDDQVDQLYRQTATSRATTSVP